MPSALLLNSGGLDSVLVAASFDGELHSLTLDTDHQARIASLAAAEEIAKNFCVSHTVLRLDLPVTGAGICRNQLVVSLAMGQSIAKSEGYDVVLSGAKGTITENYPNVWNTLNTMNTMTIGNPPVSMPLLGLPVKYDEIAEILGLDLEQFGYTHSCRYEIPCGACWKCKERARAGL